MVLAYTTNGRNMVYSNRTEEQAEKVYKQILEMAGKQKKALNP